MGNVGFCSHLFSYPTEIRNRHFQDPTNSAYTGVNNYE